MIDDKRTLREIDDPNISAIAPDPRKSLSGCGLRGLVWGRA